MPSAHGGRDARIATPGMLFTKPRGKPSRKAPNEPDSDSHVMARLLVEVVALTRPILGHPAMLPYAVAAVAFTGSRNGRGCAGLTKLRNWPAVVFGKLMSTMRAFLEGLRYATVFCI